MKNFDAVKVKNQLVEWIRNWFKENGDGCNAVIGLSGGKDSTIVAALCKEALGADRVIGVAMPDEGQDEHGADEIAKYLGIRYLVAHIGGITEAVDQMKVSMKNFPEKATEQAIQNVPPRARMMTIYYISQCLNGRVSMNCQYSERYIGYETVGGDSIGDFAPIANLTVQEVIEIGLALGLPEKWVKKVPSDDLPYSCGDEAKFGFTYKELDDYLRYDIEPVGYCHNNPDEELKIDKIKRMHKQNLFKMKPTASFDYKTE